MIVAASGTAICAAMPLLHSSEPRLRLVVRASSDRRKQYVWEIHDNHETVARVEISQQAYRTMEEAYAAGKAVMEARRPTDEPPTKLPHRNASSPGSPRGLTSSLYTRG